MIGKTERPFRHMRFGKPPRRGMTGRRRAGQHQPLPHMAALPEGIKDFVEALPIGLRGAKQRAQRRFKRCSLKGGGRREDVQCVARFGKTDVETVVAQHAGESGEAAAGDKPIDPPRSFPVWWRVPAHLRHLAEEPLAHSWVNCARSSCVLSKQIIVS